MLFLAMSRHEQNKLKPVIELNKLDSSSKKLSNRMKRVNIRKKSIPFKN